MFVVCETWVETRTDGYIDPSSSLDHSSASFASWLGLLNWGSLRAQALNLQLVHPLASCLQLTQTVQAPSYIIFWCPPASAVLLLIYTFTLDWWLGRGSIYNREQAKKETLLLCYQTLKWDITSLVSLRIYW